MNFPDIKTLLNQTECAWLDFKSEWHKSNVDLIHDVLCLANSDTASDRYLVFGWKERDRACWELVENRKNQDDVLSLIRDSHFNINPDIELKTVLYEGKELDILAIKKTIRRPYFLTKDKSDGKGRVRAGVVYTRDGSINTGKNSSASEYQIAEMWRGRFGLTYSPKERMGFYIKEEEEWVCNHDMNDSGEETMIFHHRDFPEFTIEYRVPKDMKEYSNPPECGCYSWMHSPTGNSYCTELRFKYHTTILETMTLGLCDRNRYLILQPSVVILYYNPDKPEDIHVVASGALAVSDRGVPVGRIDNHLDRHHEQVRFFYNRKNTRTYFLQRILMKVHGGLYDLYDGYLYLDSNQTEKGAPRYPSRIYLLESEEDVAIRIREEFAALQLK